MDRFCLVVCAKIYTEYAREFSLPKNLPEMVKDFEMIFGEYITRSTLSEEIAVLFRAYVVDYLPIWKQEESKSQVNPETLLFSKEGPPGVVKKTKPETIQEKARKMHSKGLSFAQIGRELGVSDKTAKKFCL